MEQNVILIVLGMLFASNGLWGYITFKASKKQDKEEKNDDIKEAVVSILHDRLFQGLKFFINENQVSTEEFANIKCMYDPYRKLGGNGTVKILYERLEEILVQPKEKEQEDEDER